MNEENLNESFEQILQKAFDGDCLNYEEILTLVGKYKISTIVETGTKYGFTTKAFLRMANIVHTVEINEEYFNEARKLKGSFENISFHLGNSPDVLNKILKNIKTPVLFYLDAHWDQYNPLLDELKVIAKYNLKNSVIVIHDFKVPGKNEPGKELFYDSYNGQDYEWSWIEKDIINIYGDQFKYHYNKEAYGARVGVIYITPAQAPEY